MITRCPRLSAFFDTLQHASLLDTPGSPAAEPPSGRYALLLAGAAVVLALVVGLVGFSVGSNHNPARVLHGSVYVGNGKASARLGSAFFAVPLSLPWRDAQGRWHEDGLPFCQGTSGQTNPSPSRW